MEYIRDLGGTKTTSGKTIKSGILFRSSELYKPNKKQIEYINSIGIKRIVDLRNEAEARDDPNYDIENVIYKNYSLVDYDLNGVTHNNKFKQLFLLRSMPEMIDTYRDFIRDDYCVNKLKDALREIVLIDNYPTVFHCVTGKDRAGVVGYYLLRILGCSHEVALDDYMKQRKYYIVKANYLRVLAFIFSLDIKLANKAFYYFSVEEDFINAVNECLENRFGSLDKFISDFVELSKEDIDKFRNIVLE